MATRKSFDVWKNTFELWASLVYIVSNHIGLDGLLVHRIASHRSLARLCLIHFSHLQFRWSTNAVECRSAGCLRSWNLKSHAFLMLWLAKLATWEIQQQQTWDEHRVVRMTNYIWFTLELIYSFYYFQFAHRLGQMQLERTGSAIFAKGNFIYLKKNWLLTAIDRVILVASRCRKVP